MTEPFLAEIRIFPFNFFPRGWAFCDGQLLPIAQNTALFSLLGTTYGGNGRTTFALPDLQGAAPMHPGQGPGLSPRELGETGGSPTVTLPQAAIAGHSHPVNVSGRPGEENDAANQYWAGASISAYSSNVTGLVAMAPQAITPTGGGTPVNNMQPYLTLSFCIALVGIYPSRP